MHEEIDRVAAWADELFHQARGGHFIGPHQAHDVDELMQDLGLALRRTSNLLIENLGRFEPSRYATVGQERRAVAGHAR